MGYESKYSKDQLDRVLVKQLNGMGAEAARKSEGVSHTPAEIHGFRFAWLAAGLPQPGVGEWAFSKSLVNYLRFEATDDRGKKGWGIGKIMTALDATENEVRKAIREGGIDDRGHRTGKGGRFLTGENGEKLTVLYEGELRSDGTRIDLKSDLPVTDQAHLQRMMKLEMDELKALAKDAGVTVRKGWTKVQLAKALI